MELLDQINTKRVFPNEKRNYHRILNIQINIDSKFQLQQAILIFGTNFQKKKYTSGQKQKKMNITIEFFIFKLVYLIINFQLKQTIAIFWTEFAQKG